MIKWSSFLWKGFEMGGKSYPKSVLLFPFKLDGYKEPFWMQLDTGCYKTIFYEHQVKELLDQTPTHGTDGIRISGYCGNYQFTDYYFHIKKNYGSRFSGTSRLGTVGLDFIIGKILLLDYPKSRFCVLDRNQDGQNNYDFGSPIKIEKNHIMVDIGINQIELRNVVFDSGSSLFEITVSQEMWRNVTGRSGDESDNVYLTVGAWNDKIETVGTHMRGTIRLLNEVFVNPMIYYWSGQHDIGEWDGVNGIIGNSLFYDKYLLTIDLINNRMLLSPSNSVE